MLARTITSWPRKKSIEKERVEGGYSFELIIKINTLYIDDI